MGRRPPLKGNKVEEPELMTLKEVAQLLRVSLMTVHRLVKAGVIPGAFRLGGDTGNWRVHRKTLWEWMNKP